METDSKDIFIKFSLKKLNPILAAFLCDTEAYAVSSPLSPGFGVRACHSVVKKEAW